MAAFNKFNVFARDVGQSVHNLQAAGHLLKVYASNVAPIAGTHAVKSDIAEITAQNGYPAGGSDIQNDYTLVGAVGQCTGVDVQWIGTGGSFGPFRYIILYNDTPTSPLDPLIGWWDYGSSITVLDTQTFTTDFGATVFTVT